MIQAGSVKLRLLLAAGMGDLIHGRQLDQTVKAKKFFFYCITVTLEEKKSLIFMRVV